MFVYDDNTVNYIKYYDHKANSTLLNEFENKIRFSKQFKQSEISKKYNKKNKNFE